MIGNGYWATGITVKHGYAGGGQHGWLAWLNFFDDGFADDDVDYGQASTQGTLTTRYYVSDGACTDGLTAALDAVLADAARLCITFRDDPCLYVPGDGEDPAVVLPDGWRDLLASQAARIGWRAPHSLVTA